MSKTYDEIANDYRLWAEHVDPSGLQTRADFDAMTVDDRIAFIKKCFGEEDLPDCPRCGYDMGRGAELCADCEDEVNDAGLDRLYPIRDGGHQIIGWE